MLAVLCAVTAVTATTACQRAATEPPGEDLPDMEADRIMYGVEFFSNADGVKRARTSADTAFAFNNADSATLHLRNMKVEMYDENGAKSGTVTAKSGVINSRTKAMVARGKVVMVTVKEGKRIETEELHYDPNTHRIWSNVPTLTINRDGSRQTMKTFETDDKFRNFQATGARGATGIRF
jgi:LPS export ABC transporter protein LptC